MSATNNGMRTVIIDHDNIAVVRDGEPWGRDLVGDNLTYWMFEAAQLQAQRDALLAACLRVDKAFANAGDWPDTSSELMELHEAISAMRFALPEAGAKAGGEA